MTLSFWNKRDRERKQLIQPVIMLSHPMSMTVIVVRMALMILVAGMKKGEEEQTMKMKKEKKVEKRRIVDLLMTN